MKTKTAFLSMALFLTSLVTLSQVKEKGSDQNFKKNLIGIQYLPLFDRSQTYSGNLFSVRYGYKIAKPLTIGTELSGYFTNKNYGSNGQFFAPNFIPSDHYGVSTNLFLRYSVPSAKRIQGFLEVSPYAHIRFEKPMKYQDIVYFIYVAPGLSVFSKDRNFSMDLSYKLSTQTFHNGTHGVLSYKLNLHF